MSDPIKGITHGNGVPDAVGPYSAAVLAGQYTFISGQLPVDPDTGEIQGQTAAEQARQSLTNLAAVLKEAGLELANVVKTTVFLADIADFAAVNEVYADAFAASEVFPSRSAFQVAALPKGALVEIEAIAWRG